MKRYALVNYILSIDIPDDVASDFGTSSIQIGGEGSYLNQISIGLKSDLYATQGDNTGSWVHVKNLDKTGTVEIQIKQVSDAIARFKALCNIYYSLSTEADGLTLTLRDLNNNTIAICNDCVLNKIPDQTFGNEPENQTWTFNAGSITFVNS